MYHEAPYTDNLSTRTMWDVSGLCVCGRGGVGGGEGRGGGYVLLFRRAPYTDDQSTWTLVDVGGLCVGGGGGGGGYRGSGVRPTEPLGTLHGRPVHVDRSLQRLAFDFHAANN